MKATYYLSTTPETLQTLNPTVTIEAEYGEACIEGTKLTLAHHGSRSNNPAPCVAVVDTFVNNGEVVGLSHVDLDTLGGIMAVEGLKDNMAVPGFWELAAFVDVQGPHKLAEAGADAVNMTRLYAWWAWSQDNRCPRQDRGESTPLVVTEYVALCVDTLILIFKGDKELLTAGEAFKKAEAQLNEDSFLELFDRRSEVDGGGIIAIRVASAFCNHLYVTPDGTICDGVINLNPKTGSITLSWADTGKKNACAVMQEVFGPKAGGHAGIAGSERNKRMGIKDLYALLGYMSK